MGRTKVKATGVDPKGATHTVTGVSGNGAAVWENINAGMTQRYRDAAELKAMFSNPDFTTPTEGEKRTGVSCAEPHAVSQLVAKGVALKDIQLEIAADEGGKKVECHFCGRWIHHDGKIDEAAVRDYIKNPHDVPQWYWS